MNVAFRIAINVPRSDWETQVPSASWQGFVKTPPPHPHPAQTHVHNYLFVFELAVSFIYVI